MESLLDRLIDDPAIPLVVLLLAGGAFFHARRRRANEIVSRDGESRRHLTERLNLELTQDGFDPASPEGRALFKARWLEETQDPG